MFYNDMAKRMSLGMAKVKKALEEGGGHTILSSGITGDDARMARAVVEAGVKMLEPNHPAVALARGHKGVTVMHDAEAIRHEITVDQMAEVTRGVRSVVPSDVYITVGIPGDFMKMALAGADGLHTHKSSLKDLEELVAMAHRYGLLVDAYIGRPTDLHTFGLPAETPEEVYKVAKQMEEVGTDMIGMMTGMSYEGVAAGEIPSLMKERVIAMVEAVKVPTLAEGGINTVNFQAFKDTKVNILVVGTAIDNMVEQAAQQAVRQFL